MRPPFSLCKPHVSDTTPNRAFLRGFSATQFPDFGLCRRSRILVAGFGALSPHLKIPFPAVGLEREVRPRFAPGIRDRGRALQLFRIESERLKLPAPFGRRIAEPLDADAAGQATFYRSSDKIGRDEGTVAQLCTCGVQVVKIGGRSIMALQLFRVEWAHLLHRLSILGRLDISDIGMACRRRAPRDPRRSHQSGRHGTASERGTRHAAQGSGV